MSFKRVGDDPTALRVQKVCSLLYRIELRGFLMVGWNYLYGLRTILRDLKILRREFSANDSTWQSMKFVTSQV